MTIRGSSPGYSQPLVDIIQTIAWDGNYALQVTGFTNLGGFRIFGDDGNNSINQTLANKDIGISQFPGGTNTGNISIITYGTGRIRLYTNGLNERVRIDNAGLAYFGGTNLYVGALDTTGLRLEKNTIFTNSLNGGGITIFTENTGQNIKLGFFGGNGIIVTVNNTSVGISQPLSVTGNISLTSGTYRNGGISIARDGKFRSGSGALVYGYFIDPAVYSNSMMICAFSHDSTSYQVWHGRISINKNGAVTDCINFYAPNSMYVEKFIELTTLKSWIYISPNTAYTTTTNLFAKIYG